MSAVDVVIPCYNYARFLSRCVGSVLQQPDVDVRVLIIDDCSSDNTPEVSAQLASDPRVEFRRHERNLGHIATYNEGLLDWATAEYSVLLSADDALSPGALARAVRLMNANAEVSLVFGFALVFNDEVQVDSSFDPKTEDSRTLQGADFIRHCCAFANPVPTPTAIVRTRIQHDIGGYRAHLPHSGDMEMWMRFATRGSVGVLRSVQAYYRWHGGNMGTNYYDAQLGDLQEQLDACRECLEDLENPTIDTTAMLGLVRRRVGEQAFWMASKAFDLGDLERCGKCLAFASEHFKDIRATAMWQRFRLKQIMGYNLWKRMKPLLEVARGRSTGVKPVQAAQFRVGELMGWWPG
jgi:glycosyltransferase involved in cell wall biosynthesis